MRLRRGEHGAAVVEFALVLPILMMFIFGIVEFGRGYNARIELTAAVREGVRTAALGGTAAETEARTRAAAVGLAGNMRFTPAPVLCTGAAEPPNAVVTADYEFTYDILFVGRRTRYLTATGVMRCGG
jgi:Flp pilus assembly protein TadG